MELRYLALPYLRYLTPTRLSAYGLYLASPLSASATWLF